MPPESMHNGVRANGSELPVFLGTRAIPVSLNVLLISIPHVIVTLSLLLMGQYRANTSSSQEEAARACLRALQLQLRSHRLFFDTETLLAHGT